MSSPSSLIELLLNLLRDPGSLAAYRDDPEGYFSSCGDLSAADVHEALVLLQDKQDADFGRDHHTGGGQVHVPPPPPPPAPEPGESEQEVAVRYLDTYITNNYVDDRDTIVDNSVNQQIDTDGGDFDQDIDIDSTAATGDGSVAAGDDIEDSEITTGEDNVVGDDNVTGEDNVVGDDNTTGDNNVVGDDNESVNGDDNTTSFGDGDSTSTEIDGNVGVDDGSALGVGGEARVDNTDNSTEDSHNDNSDHSLDNAGNDYSEHTDDAHNSTEDSYNDDNDSYTDSNNSVEESYTTEVV